MAADEVEIRLIQQAAAGNAAAMEYFLLRHREALLRYLHRRVPDDVRQTVDPQDILQDVYVEAFRRIGAFRATDNRSALRWLLTLARHRLLNLIEMQRAAKRGGGKGVNWRELAASEQSVVVLLQDLAVYERTPSQSAVAHEVIAALQSLIGQLPGDWQTAIRLRYLEGQAVEAIAARMNRTAGAVQMLCNRAIKKLRGQLQAMSLFA